MLEIKPTSRRCSLFFRLIDRSQEGSRHHELASNRGGRADGHSNGQEVGAGRSDVPLFQTSDTAPFACGAPLDAVVPDEVGSHVEGGLPEVLTGVFGKEDGSA